MNTAVHLKFFIDVQLNYNVLISAVQQSDSVLCMKVVVTQLCQTLCNPMDCSPPGSSVHGILQARILEWVAVSFSRELYKWSYKKTKHSHFKRKPLFFVQSYFTSSVSLQMKKYGEIQPQGY